VIGRTCDEKGKGYSRAAVYVRGLRRGRGTQKAEEKGEIRELWIQPLSSSPKTISDFISA